MPRSAEPLPDETVARERAFLDLVNRHRGLIRLIASGYATTADRDDLFQEIVCQLWRAYPRYRGESAAVTWIYRVALNTAITTLRRRGRRPAHLPIEAFPEPSIAAQTDDDRPIEALYRAIRRLPEIDRALIMCYLDDLSYREIAHVLGISESNVGVRLARVKKRLQALLVPRE